jgi:hypothetical protein
MEAPSLISRGFIKSGPVAFVVSSNCSDDLICDNFAKCALINDFFSEQSNLDDSNSTVPEPIDPLYDKLTQLHITETDIEDVLQLLDTTKATGPDLINPRLLFKRRGFHFEASII